MKPKVDITDSNGSRWTMGKMVSDALGEGTVAQNVFLSKFNVAAVESSDDDVLAILMKHAVLVFEGAVIGSSEGETPAKMAEGMEMSTEITVSNDPKQLGSDAVEYLTGVQTLDVNAVGYEGTVAFLADVKAMISAIETKRKDLTKGARETVTKINAEFKPAEDHYKKAEEILKEKLVEFRADVRSIRDRLLAAGEDPIEPVPEVEGVVVKEKWDIRVVDVKDLPAEYLMPNMKAIEAALKNGATIPGVIAGRVETLAVEHKKVKR